MTHRNDRIFWKERGWERKAKEKEMRQRGRDGRKEVRKEGRKEERKKGRKEARGTEIVYEMHFVLLGKVLYHI